MRILTAEGQALAKQYKKETIGCSCHICPPCGDCTHPGNPLNLEESDDLWEEAKVYTNWAYTSGEQAKAESNAQYFEQLKHLRSKEHMSFTTSPQYAHTTFNGELLSEEAQALTADEILLLMDHGNLCFGGSCSKSGTKFSGSYNTD